jgi:hypothetical protein
VIYADENIKLIQAYLFYLFIWLQNDVMGGPLISGVDRITGESGVSAGGFVPVHLKQTTYLSGPLFWDWHHCFGFDWCDRGLTVGWGFARLELLDRKEVKHRPKW